jgi:hypothetical protein
MMLYLNSGGADFQGGGTSFFNARGERFATAPRAGSVLLFEHFLEHQGDELLGGVKYAIRSDVMYKRDGDREGKGGGRGLEGGGRNGGSAERTVGKLHAHQI